MRNVAVALPIPAKPARGNGISRSRNSSTSAFFDLAMSVAYTRIPCVSACKFRSRLTRFEGSRSRQA
jgi:hypothetical protein